MDTPPLKVNTQATAGLIPQLGLDGRMYQVAVIKELFSFAGGSQALSRIGGAEVRYVDEPYDEDHADNIRLPSDAYIGKPGTDVVVVGSAEAPGGDPATEVDVAIRVGALRKRLRVFGSRVWYEGGGLGMTMSDPEPFVRVPLRWDLAFGGFDVSDPSAPPLEEPRNPIGRGLAQDPTRLHHMPAPQIEDPEDLIGSHRSRPQPAGVGALGRHWSPRREYAGTYDAEWAADRMPLPPFDFDVRFHHFATPELVSPTPLRGGEPVELVGLSARGPLTFALPKLSFYVGSRVDGELRHHPAVLDTVLFDTDNTTVELTWRAQVPVPRPVRRLHYVLINEREIL